MTALALGPAACKLLAAHVERLPVRRDPDAAQRIADALRECAEAGGARVHIELEPEGENEA